MNGPRARSPLAGRKNNSSHSPSPSTNGAYNTNADALSIDPLLVKNIQDTFSAAYNNDALSRNNVPYPISTAYLDDTPAQTYPYQQQSEVADHTFLPLQKFRQAAPSAQFDPQGEQHPTNLVTLDNLSGA